MASDRRYFLNAIPKPEFLPWKLYADRLAQVIPEDIRGKSRFPNSIVILIQLV